jgi:hypothetical protein
VSGTRDQVRDLDRLVALVNNLPICSARVQPLFCISLTKRHISEVYDGYDVFERDEGGVRALSVVHVGADLRSTGGAGMDAQICRYHAIILGILSESSYVGGASWAQVRGRIDQAMVHVES